MDEYETDAPEIIDALTPDEVERQAALRATAAAAAVADFAAEVDDGDLAKYDPDQPKTPRRTATGGTYLVDQHAAQTLLDGGTVRGSDFTAKAREAREAADAIADPATDHELGPHTRPDGEGGIDWGAGSEVRHVDPGTGEITTRQVVALGTMIKATEVLDLPDAIRLLRYAVDAFVETVGAIEDPASPVMPTLSEYAAALATLDGNLGLRAFVADARQQLAKMTVPLLEQRVQGIPEVGVTLERVPNNKRSNWQSDDLRGEIRRLAMVESSVDHKTGERDPDREHGARLMFDILNRAYNLSGWNARLAELRRMHIDPDDYSIATTGEYDIKVHTS